MLYVPKPEFRPATLVADPHGAEGRIGWPALDNRAGRGQTPADSGLATLGGGDIMKTNYPAVIVCAIAYWLLGALWYAVLFNKPWVALEGAAGRSGSMNPYLSHVITFALNLLIAFVLAQICIWRNGNTAGRGAAIGVLLWLGIIGPITFTTYMYEGRSNELFAINEVYPLAGLCLMGAILGAWTKKAA